MITKFNLVNSNDSDLRANYKLLRSHNFYNITQSPNRSTHDLFEADLEGKHFFIKLAYSNHVSGKNLILQHNILSELYPKFNAFIGKDLSLTYLAMESLKKPNNYNFVMVNELIANIGKTNQTLKSMVPFESNIKSLILKAYSARDFFYENKLIDSNLFTILKEQLDKITKHTQSLDPTVNHGDLSNFNIFIYNENPILIDWEDVMLGFSGYDQVYWLTFLANVNQIDRATLRSIPAPLEVVHATFFLVVLLKEYLKLSSKINSNIISTQNRLSALLQLPDFG